MSVITQGGRSALMSAASNGHTKVVVELVKAGADLNLQNDVCHNILHVFLRNCLYGVILCIVPSIWQVYTCNFELKTDIKLVVVCAYT